MFTMHINNCLFNKSVIVLSHTCFLLNNINEFDTYQSVIMFYEEIVSEKCHI